uniref:Uncharacterized protein n=1 Tax=Sphaerodactylus townsendi TaxID=933632 RepID=A0ACB8ESQ4_9SAUR
MPLGKPSSDAQNKAKIQGMRWSKSMFPALVLEIFLFLMKVKLQVNCLNMKLWECIITTVVFGSFSPLNNKLSMFARYKKLLVGREVVSLVHQCFLYEVLLWFF